MRCKTLMVAALTLAAAGRAGATPPVGTCGSENNGPAFEGIVGLAVPDGMGGFASVAAAAVPYVFGGAECSCASDDVQLEIRVTTALSLQTAGSAEVWVGAGCDDAATRRAGVACERVATLSIDIFTSSSASGPIHVPIPSQALFAPVTHACPAAGTMANSIYVLIGSQVDAPVASCTLDLVEKARPPAAPTNVKVSRTADGTAHLSWTPAAAGSDAPIGYQVLCADSQGAVVREPPSSAMYSVCEPGRMLKRRSLPTGQPIEPQTGTAPSASQSLAAFDPSFVCSSILSGGATSTDIALSDLGESYQLQLVAFDTSGNFAPGPLVSVGAAPVMAPAGKSGGGCSLAGRSGGSGGNAGWGALMLGLLAAWRTRTRARAKARAAVGVRERR